MNGQAPVDPQQLQAALAQLHDISLPADPSIWPLATGWWLLLGAVFAVALALAAFLFWRKKTALKRAASAHLASLAESDSLDDQQFLQMLAETLRRAAKQRYPEMVGFTGDDWAAALNRTGATNYFTTNAGEQLLQARFGKVKGVNREQQLTAVQAWLEAAL